MPQPAPAALPVAGGFHAFKGHQYTVSGLAFSPDGRFALSAGLDGTIRLWDVTTHKYMRAFAERTNGVRSVAFTPDGRFALSGHDDKLLRLWDVQTGGLIRRFQGHTQTVNKVAISPDGRQALSGGFDHSVRLWDIATGQELHNFAGHTQLVRTVQFSSDRRHALSASADGSVRIYDLVEKKQRWASSWQDNICAIYKASFSGDGRQVVLYGARNVAWVGETATGKKVRDFACKTQSMPGAVAFTPDGRKGLSQDKKSNDLWLWSTETGRHLGCFTGLGHEITSLVISPDGNHALAGCINGTVYMWSLVPPAAAKK
jgi:WD40 repeat protein